MLSDKEVLEEIKKGSIVIRPFNRKQLGTNSYDVRLGDHIAVGNPAQRILDVYSEQDIKDYWAIKKVNHILTLFPGETILAHTIEVIGGKDNITSRMSARSSVGRCGVSVCLCAGFGDIGFINHWTMEIANHLNIPVILKVGMRVAQISFFRTGVPTKQYEGKYQEGKCIIPGESWKPEDMIPKLWKDWEVKENVI